MGRRGIFEFVLNLFFGNDLGNIPGAIFPSDRDLGFRWFAKLVADESDLDPELLEPFFQRHLLQLDVSWITERGLACFQEFFKAVNARGLHLVVKRHVIHLNSMDPIGVEYLWKIIHYGREEIAGKAIEFLVDVYGSPTPLVQERIQELHADFLNTCRNHLKGKTSSFLGQERIQEVF